MEDDGLSFISTQTFAGTHQWLPYQCPVSPGTIEIDVDISIDRYQPKYLYTPIYYANHVNRIWPTLFSQNVDQVSYYFSRARIDFYGVEYLPEAFKVHFQGGTEVFDRNTYNFVGWAGPWQAKTTGNHNSAYLENSWESGSTRVGFDTGYSINKMRLSCVAANPPANSVYILRNTPYDAVLLGDGDVIYGTTFQPAGHEMAIIIWPVNMASGADLDLFISTSSSNTMPSAASNDAASARGIEPTTGVMYPEMVLLDAPSVDRNVYIAAGSYSGKGHFRLYANVHSPNYPEAPKITTDWNPSAADKGLIKKLLLKMAQSMYWATDGRHLIKRFDIYWNQVVSSAYMVFTEAKTDNVCFVQPWVGPADHGTYSANEWCGCNRDPTQGGTPGCPCSSAHDDLQQWAANIGLHELSHCMYYLADEYPNSWVYGCGHSVMAAYYTSASNTVDYCDSINGGTDPYSGIGHPFWFDQWPYIENSFPSNPAKPINRTPDAFYETGRSDTGDKPFSDHIQIVEH